jgi:hypothetical protein
MGEYFAASCTSAALNPVSKYLGQGIKLRSSQARLRNFLIAVVSFWASGSALAIPFTGNFQPDVYFDDNIFDQVQIRQAVGNVAITQGAGPNDLNVQFAYGAKNVSLSLTTTGNIAHLATLNVDIGSATVLDLLLLSDGNNEALLFAEKAKSGTDPKDIGFAVAHWQRTPGVVQKSIVGKWQLDQFYGSPNLRSENNGLHPLQGPISFEVTDSPLMFLADGLSAPLTQNGNRAFIANTPFAAATAVVHTFDWILDDSGTGSLIFVAAEPNDPTDVNIYASLVRSVPEPSSVFLFTLLCPLIFIFSRGLSAERGK